MNAITNYSNIQYRHDSYTVSLGRTENTNVGYLTDLLLSPQSPGMDQLCFSFTKSRFSFTQIISNLDSRASLTNSDDIVNRWMYFHRLNFKVFDHLQVAIQEMLIASGVGRTLDWQYLTPFGLMMAEDFHEAIDNHNHENVLVGVDWRYQNNNIEVYNQWVIDEFQIDSDDRKRLQDIFGVMAGMSLQSEYNRLILEYAYASPWLYLHSGEYTSPERHGFPLGLRAPHSQSVDFLIAHTFKNADVISFQTHMEWRGEQTLETDHDPVYNKIDYFDFKEVLDPEFKLQYQFADNPYLDAVSFYHNWLQSDFTTVLLSWEFKIE